MHIESLERGYRDEMGFKFKNTVPKPVENLL